MGLIGVRPAMCSSWSYLKYILKLNSRVTLGTINPKKLTDYALNPYHPVSGNKAKVFDSVLGYNQSNAEDLLNQVYSKLPDSEAVLGKLDEYGQRYTENTKW